MSSRDGTDSERNCGSMDKIGHRDSLTEIGQRVEKRYMDREHVPRVGRGREAMATSTTQANWRSSHCQHISKPTM